MRGKHCGSHEIERLQLEVVLHDRSHNKGSSRGAWADAEAKNKWLEHCLVEKREELTQRLGIKEVPDAKREF